MQDIGTSNRLRALSPRERDCLRLIAAGHTFSDVAADLGIARSTLDKHLASARHKLEARTTVQAVLRFEAETEAVVDTDEAMWTELTDSSETAIALVERLKSTRSFSAAWTALHASTADFGVVAINFGIVADPSGVISDRTYMFRSSAPAEMTNLYVAIGGHRVDPIPRIAVRDKRPFVHIVSETARGLFADEMPPGLSDFLECLFDNKLDRQAFAPGSDPLTGATYGLNFIVGGIDPTAFRRTVPGQLPTLRRFAQLFWHYVQTHGLLRDFVGLNHRESEALRLVARGFRTAEVGDHMNVSNRSAETYLAGARRKLKATTNAEAIYRGMVYRVFNDETASRGAIVRRATGGL
ncbi:response regulator transcription factor [Bauldia sp.]|uniref:response regulator transcription factor n=1 Tax=Bauldia sp. TaxID=2575872 RepID=UPI003BAA36B7